MAKAVLHGKRHRKLFRFFKALLKRPFSKRFAYEFEPLDSAQAPYLVVANHNTDYDPILLALSFDHVYFVASDHIFRLGLISKLLVFLVSPIPRRKATVSSASVMEIRRRIMAGYSVCLFAEGERSYDGNTALIHPTIGKLILAMRATLVTFRFTGGYFTCPRWSFKRRKGKMQGLVQGVYPFADLKKLSSDEIRDLVQRDIQENAYEEQQKQPIPFYGETLAEGLETALYLCPSCRNIGTLTTAGERIACTCGFYSDIDVYGYFSDPAPHTFTAWYHWQREELRRRLEAGESFPLRDQVKLMRIDDKKKTELAAGLLKMTADAIAVGEDERYCFSFEKLPILGMYGRNRLVFTYDDVYYVIFGEKSFNARYYLHIFDFYTKNEVNR